MKQKAIGWPEWVGDNVDKRQRYVQDYLEKEGIQLDPDKIQVDVLSQNWRSIGSGTSTVNKATRAKSKLFCLQIDCTPC